MRDECTLLYIYQTRTCLHCIGLNFIFAQFHMIFAQFHMIFTISSRPFLVAQKAYYSGAYNDDMIVV